MTIAAWIGIVVCFAHSAMFSGLNLAFFSLTRLQLELETKQGNRDAKRVLAMRKDSNYLLTTILWGNVATNCLLTLLSDSVLAGLAGFCFSTFGITLFGEIMPQAYFSRHALKMGGILSPVIRVYQILLMPLAKPTAIILDNWLGKEGVAYMREQDIQILIDAHIKADASDIDSVEGVGVLNMLTMDDLPIESIAQPVDPDSVLRFVFSRNVVPDALEQVDSADHPLIAHIAEAEHKWMILVDDATNEPRMVLDADSYLRAALLGTHKGTMHRHCHRPIVVRDPDTPLKDVLPRLRVDAEHHSDHVIDDDMVLVWTDTPKIVTGADLLGVMLKGIVQRRSAQMTR